VDNAPLGATSAGLRGLALNRSGDAHMFWLDIDLSQRLAAGIDEVGSLIARIIRSHAAAHNKNRISLTDHAIRDSLSKSSHHAKGQRVPLRNRALAVITCRDRTRQQLSQMEQLLMGIRGMNAIPSNDDGALPLS